MFKKNKNLDRKRQPARPSATGSPVFSYYSNRPSGGRPTSKKPVRHHKAVNLKLIPSILAGVAIFISLAYASSLNTNPRIQRGTTSDSPLLQSNAVYQAAAQKQLESSLLSRSKLLINTRAIEQELAGQFPELASVSITVPLSGRRPIISLRPVQPALLLASDRQTYVLDEKGRAVKEVDDLEPYLNLNLPVVQDNSGIAIETGKVVLPAGDTAFIRELARQLREQAVEVRSFVLANQPHELHVRLEKAQYYVKFNTQGDPRLQAGTFAAVAKELRDRSQKPSEYIDVRVEEKAYYK